jgi:hypothetical protein
LPGRPHCIGHEQVRSREDTLIFGERSGGVSNFLSWWCEELDREPRIPWVQVRGSAWDRAFFDCSLEAKPLLEKEGGSSLIEDIGRAATTHERAKALVEWARLLKEPSTLILRDLSALGAPADQQVAEALAVVRETIRLPNLRLVVADAFETIYQSTRNSSGLLRFCHAYRLAPLDEEAIRALAAHAADDRRPLILAGDALRSFIEHTGGQPLLVQHLLYRLLSVARSQLDESDVEQAARRLRAAPPAEVGVWKSDLRRLLKEHPHLRQPMETYVAGGTLGPARFPPPSEESPLFIAGWVRLNRSRRWGIASGMHRDLARAVLDERSEANHE